MPCLFFGATAFDSGRIAPVIWDCCDVTAWKVSQVADTEILIELTPSRPDAPTCADGLIERLATVVPGGVSISVRYENHAAVEYRYVAYPTGARES